VDISQTWRLSASCVLPLDRARILGILNITPDSFSDGGEIQTPAQAVAAAQRMIDAGADALDIGGESTRPGADPVSSDEQIRRVVPVIAGIRAAGIDAPITVDTTRSAVARAALDAGADAVNDVSAALDDADMLPLIAERQCGVILMHRLCRPSDDRYSHEHLVEPDYGPLGVVGAVRQALSDRAEAAIAAGVDRRRIALDPGLGFGKSVAQSFELIRRSGEIVSLGLPVIGGASRKSFLGAATGVDRPADRVASSLAASVIQRLGGVAIFRVHDVSSHREALAVADAALFKAVS